MNQKQKKQVIFAIVVLTLAFVLFSGVSFVEQSIYNETAFYATSGSPSALQTAVNQANSAGGGTVHIPAGTFDWHGETVTIPEGVSVMGASPAGCAGETYNWQLHSATTILLNHGTGTFPVMFYIDGEEGANGHTRISGIRFERADPPATESTSGGSNGIDAFNCINVRVDHCDVVGFEGHAIGYYARESKWNWGAGQEGTGVVDHCFFDAPYKEVQTEKWSAGYVASGVISSGAMDTTTGNWDYSSISKYAGRYQVFPDAQITYVEDCVFRRMRHSIDGNYGGVSVVRHCLFDCLADESSSLKWNCGEVCLHPAWTSQNPQLLIECYNNIFTNDGNLGQPNPKAVTSSSMRRNCPWHPNQPHSMLANVQRGTSGLYFNNEYYQSESAPNYQSIFVYLRDEAQVPAIGAIDETYIWNNVVTNAYTADADGDGIQDGIVKTSSEVDLNVDFFMRAPNSASDGWTYTPFVYPHPLVSGSPIPTPAPTYAPTPTPSVSPTPVPSGSPSPTPTPPPSAPAEPTAPIDPDKIAVDISKEGDGSTSPVVGSYEYDKNSTITFKATPASGWVFSCWVKSDGSFIETPDVIYTNVQDSFSLKAVFVESDEGLFAPIDYTGNPLADFFIWLYNALLSWM